MKRTQISLAPHELNLLDDASRQTGASRSELIRRAIRETYNGDRRIAESGPRRLSELSEAELRAKFGPARRSKKERMANIRAAAGIWKDRPFTTEEYLQAIRGRGGMNERLRRLGLE